MKKFTLTFWSIVAFLCCNNAYSQETDSVKQARIKYISKDLSVPDIKAQEVILIMDQYKETVKKLVNDKSITEQLRRAKFDQLIDEKNGKLQKILTEEQLQKIIPTTERRKGKPPVAGKK